MTAQERIIPTALLFIACAAGAETVTTTATLSLDGARTVIAAAKDEARNRGAPGGSIAVVDNGGNLIAVERLDRTFPASTAIAIEKARTAALFRKPSAALEEAVNGGRTAMVTLPAFTLLQGGVPILRAGEVIGAVGVSGAASALQDEEIAAAAAAHVEEGRP
jgi:glc operon protein GlcG